MIDVAEQINAVSRQLGSRVFGPGEARVITITQTYAADADDVWDACTSPARIQRWFMPITGELKLGGKYQLEGNAGGTVERCDPPKSFFVTWEYGGQVSWLEIRVVPETDEKTRLELEHIAHVDERWTEYGPGAVGIGWDMAMLGLAQHLSHQESAITPEQSATWFTSTEGVEFMSESSERWYAADVAFGTDAEQARAAADRTKAAYTTPPETQPEDS